jgi:hypothetical protein
MYFRDVIGAYKPSILEIPKMLSKRLIQVTKYITISYIKFNNNRDKQKLISKEVPI